MKFCIKCGNPVNEGVKFCNKCGWQLTSNQKVMKEDNKTTIPVKRGKIRCIKGNNIGKTFNAPGMEKVVMGTNPAKCKILVTGKYVSHTHCSVTYMPELDKYEVTDYGSTNGTFVNGKEIPKKSSMNCVKGTILSIADEDNQYQLM